MTSDGPLLPLGTLYLAFFAAGVGVVGVILQLPVSGSDELVSTSLILCTFGFSYWFVTATLATIASILL